MLFGDSSESGGIGAQPRPLRVVFCGDSRADWWAAPTLPGVQCFNRGLPGYGAATVLERFDIDVTPLRPDVVVVQVGVNDLVMFMPRRQDRALLLAGIYTATSAIVAKARGLGAHVVLTTIFPLAHGWEPDAVVQEAIAEINRNLFGLAAPNIEILDSAAVLTGSDGYVRDAYADDALHLNWTGYAALNAALVPLLLRLLEQRNT